MGFLRDLFPERRISEISYIRTEHQGLSERERNSVFDVVCSCPDGVQFVVEVQKKSQKHFRDRALYYATFPIREQAAKGRWDYGLTPVCIIGILNFALDHGPGFDGRRWKEKFVHRYRLREDETGEIMNSNLEFVYLEVGAFRKDAGELNGNMDKWMYVLKNLARLTDRPYALQDRVFGMLFAAAEIAAYSPADRNQYEHDIMTENDYWNTIDYAKEEARREGLEEGRAEGKALGIAEGREQGIAEGMEKGMVEGRAEGRAEGRIEGKALGIAEIARKLLACGMTEAQVSSITELTAEQLACLK